MRWKHRPVPGKPKCVSLRMFSASAPRTQGRRQRLQAPRGYPPERQVEHVRALAYLDLVRVSLLIGRTEQEAPSIPEYEAFGIYSYERVQRAFGKHRWKEAMVVAGLRPAADQSIPLERIKRDIHRVASLVGRPAWMPTAQEYEAHGEFHPRTLRNRLADGGPWEKVAENAGLMYRHGNATYISNGEIISRFRKACSARGIPRGGKGLSQREWALAEPEIHHLYRRRFGTFSAFLEAAGYTPRPPGGGRKRGAFTLAEEGSSG